MFKMFMLLLQISTGAQSVGTSVDDNRQPIIYKTQEECELAAADADPKAEMIFLQQGLVRHRDYEMKMVCKQEDTI